MKKLIGLFVLLVFAAGMSYAAETGAVAGQAKAKIIEEVDLQHVSNAALDFGTIINTSGGTVTIPANSNTAQYSSGVAAASGSTTRDQFTITGLSAGTNYTVEVDSSVTLEGPSAGDEMTATLSPSITSAIQGPSDVTLYVGGVLTVASDQAVGDYLGSYNVNVTY